MAEPNNDSNKRPASQIFIEGLLFGAGLTVAAGILRALYGWMISNEDEEELTKMRLDALAEEYLRLRDHRHHHEDDEDDD